MTQFDSDSVKSISVISSKYASTPRVVSSKNDTKYKITKKILGDGSFSKVKQCIRKSDNKEFKVKFTGKF